MTSSSSDQVPAGHFFISHPSKGSSGGHPRGHRRCFALWTIIANQPSSRAEVEGGKSGALSKLRQRFEFRNLPPMRREIVPSRSSGHLVAGSSLCHGNSAIFLHPSHGGQGTADGRPGGG